MAKFYRVSGESNQHKGIIPDITVEPTEEDCCHNTVPIGADHVLEVASRLAAILDRSAVKREGGAAWIGVIR